jgi:hypothetical protein
MSPFMMEHLHSPQILLTAYTATWRHSPEDHNLQEEIQLEIKTLEKWNSKFVTRISREVTMNTEKDIRIEI